MGRKRKDVKEGEENDSKKRKPNRSQKTPHPSQIEKGRKRTKKKDDNDDIGPPNGDHHNHNYPSNAVPGPSNSSPTVTNVSVPIPLTPGQLKAQQNAQNRREKEKRKNQLLRLREQKQKNKAPLHDPEQQGALVLYPSQNEELGMDQVPVVVDPRLALDLQKHQIEGVRKAYKHLTSKESAGFMFADSPGLGKTLQCLTVIWTLITQSKVWDYEQEKVLPLIQKAIIICPKQVIPVWKQQIQLWLKPRGEGPTTETLRILVIEEKMSLAKKREEATNFMTKDSPYKTLICNYESFINLGKQYQKNNDVNNPLLDGPLTYNSDNIVGLLVADEAHYIKNEATERSAFVTDFPVKKRIAITGTPMQNKLEEYYAILKWLEPCAIPIDEDSSFKEMYQQPIQAWIDGGKDPTCVPIALKRLRSCVRRFQVRRSRNPFVTTSNTEFIICCKMSNNSENSENLQKMLYNAFAEGFKLQQPLLPEPGQQQPEDDTPPPPPKPKKRRKKQDNGLPEPKKITGFEAIFHLKSICAQPLFKATALKKLSADVPVLKKVHEILTNDDTSNEDPNDPNLSAKLIVLKRILQRIRANEDKKDRVVIVSSSTENLTLVEEMLKTMEAEEKGEVSGLIYPFYRFDGNTSPSNREKIIGNFNDLGSANQFIITLSSRAGGTGISLIGGNHLIMVDPDWNPANDEQAMSRIYREKQSKHCFVYRLLTTGSIEEVIFQRQMYKKILSGTIIDEDNEECIITDDMFTNEDLSSGLFAPINETRDSDSFTHRQINCKRCDIENGTSEAPPITHFAGDINYLDSWHHHIAKGTLTEDCRVLHDAWMDDAISFVFCRKILPRPREENPNPTGAEHSLPNLNVSEDSTSITFKDIFGSDDDMSD